MTTMVSLPDTDRPLDHATAHAAFGDMLDGRVADAESARFLTGLSVREETAIEIAAAATALRERMIPVTAPAHAIDVCGTGGDGSHSLNVSTAVAIVVAACGIPSRNMATAPPPPARARPTRWRRSVSTSIAPLPLRRIRWPISASPSCSRRNIIPRSAGSPRSAARSAAAPSST